MRDDTSDVLAGTTVPVLIMAGSDDKVISSMQSENMHKLAKTSQLIIFKGAGHLINIEKPDEWNDAVINKFNSYNQDSN